MNREKERLYRLFSTRPAEPTDKGRRQFREMDTHGVRPDEPEPYFLCLESGKKWFHVLQADVRQQYLTWEWWGFYSYWLDWAGERWALRHLFAWHPCPPDWLFSEGALPEGVS